MKKIVILLLVLVSCKVQYLQTSSRTLMFEDKMITLDNFNVSDAVFYNNNDVWFSKDMVKVTPLGIEIKCVKDTAEHESWQGKRITNWTSGMIETRNKVEFSNGMWVVTAKLNSGWPAIWLLKPDYFQQGIEKGQIIPEIDIVETIHDKFRHTIHWGYSNDKAVYRLYETGKNVMYCDNKFHEFAVDCISNGYDFYIDGVRTASFRSENKEFVSDQRNYLIINNAATNEDKEESIMVVRSIKYYR